MLDYDFMRTALAAGAIVAVVAGAVGYFLVLRHLAFAGHALSHVGFAGAAGAALVGIAPLWGLLAFTLAAAVAMGWLGDRLRGRDVAIGVILSLALGLGVLFLHFYRSHATQATTILFGNVFAVDAHSVVALLALGVASLIALAAIARPLLFATFAPELADAKGVSLRLVSVLFLAIVAVAVAEAAQVVGVLLVFALMVGPAATSLALTTRLATGIALSVALGLVETGAGIALAYATDWPATAWIVMLSSAAYFAGTVWSSSSLRRRRPGVAAGFPFSQE